MMVWDRSTNCTCQRTCCKCWLRELWWAAAQHFPRAMKQWRRAFSAPWPTPKQLSGPPKETVVTAHLSKWCPPAYSAKTCWKNMVTELKCRPQRISLRLQRYRSNTARPANSHSSSTRVRFYALEITEEESPHSQMNR